MDEKTRADKLRQGLEHLAYLTRFARAEGRPADAVRCRTMAIDLMLEYIGNGWIRRLWSEIEGRPPT